MRDEETPRRLDRGRGRGRPDDRDASFEALDPAWEDPVYWERFQARTLALVEPELVRRRRVLERMTVSDVVLSWSRMVVPVAVVAAAAAVMLLLTEPAAPGPASPGPASSPGAEFETATAAEAPPPAAESLDLAVDGGPIPALTEDDLTEDGFDEMPIILTAAAEGF